MRRAHHPASHSPAGSYWNFNHRDSPLDSLVANALEISCSGGEWIKDVIARASEEVEEIYSATQNANTKNVSRVAEART